METKVAVLLLLCAATSAQEISYPKVDVSFRARGSISADQIGDIKNHIQMSFDENYQKSPHRSALNLFGNGDNRTIIEHLQDKQAFIYSKLGCKQLPQSDLRLEAGIQLLKAESTGQYIFPIRQLLELKAKYLKNLKPAIIAATKIPTYRWSFFINETQAKIDIIADWTTANISSPSKALYVPLSFEIQGSIYDALAKKWEKVKQVVLVESFTLGEIDEFIFKPRRGVYCPGRIDPNGFPERVAEKLKTLHTKVKNVVKEFSQRGVLDTWVGPNSKHYRINYAHSARTAVKKGIQRIVSHVQGVVYEIKEAHQCSVQAVKDLKDQLQSETIFNPLDKVNFNIKDFFGLDNKVDYVTLGETVEGEIPCVIYQAKRSDWPPALGSKIESVWEWCLANSVIPEAKLQVNGFPLVSLKIYITDSPFSVGQSPYVKGVTLAYSFYDVKSYTEEYLDNLAVDIKECFEEANQKRLLFRAKVEEKVQQLLLKNTRRMEHIAAWKAAICNATHLHPGTLRVSDVQTRLDKGELEVSFTLLGQHPDLPDPSKEVTLEQAVDNVKTALDQGQVAVDVTLGSDTKAEKVNLKAQPGTLNSKKETVEPLDKPKSGLTGGTIAAVAVATLALALGLAVGAAVVIIKRRRAPYQTLLDNRH